MNDLYRALVENDAGGQFVTLHDASSESRIRKYVAEELWACRVIRVIPPTLCPPVGMSAERCSHMWRDVYDSDPTGHASWQIRLEPRS